MDQPRVTHPLEPSIVAVLDNTGHPCGMGFFIEESLICTCAHVICDALGIDRQSALPPSGAVVTLRFDFLLREVTASVERWMAVPQGQDLGAVVGDIAILKLADAVPQGAARILRFIPWAVGRPIEVYGHPQQSSDGRWAEATTSYRAPLWVQLSDPKTTGQQIRPGFSGSPIWDIEAGGTVGMLVANEREASAKIAFMLPIEDIITSCQLSIRMESRDEPPGSTHPAGAAASASNSYHREQYIARTAEEKRIQTLLGSPGAIFVHGAPHSGKTWLLINFMSMNHASIDWLYINALASPSRKFAAFIEDIASKVVYAIRRKDSQRFRMAESAFAKYWARENRDQPKIKMQNFLRAVLLDEDQARKQEKYTGLVLDNIENIPDDIIEELNAATRWILDDDPELGAKLRIIVSSSTLLGRRRNNSIASASQHAIIARTITMGEFSIEQVRRMSVQYGFDLSDSELMEIAEWSAGNLFLLRDSLHHARAVSMSPGTWICAHGDITFAEYLNEIIRKPLSNEPVLRDLLCNIVNDPRAKIDDVYIMRLETAGLIKRTTAGLFLRCKAYTNFTKKLCSH